MNCKSCERYFDYVAYREFEYNVTSWGLPNEQGGRTGQGFSKKLYQPSCPFCGTPVYEGNISENHYRHDDPLYQSSEQTASDEDV